MIRIKQIKPFFTHFAVFIAIFLLMSSCDPMDKRLKIINDSNSDIYFTFSCDSSIENVKIDRTGYYSNALGDSTYGISNGFVKRKSYINYPMWGFTGWVHYVNNCPNQEISFYFFLDSVVTRYSDKVIKDMKLFDKHVIESLKELKQNNWTIKYP